MITCAPKKKINKLAKCGAVAATLVVAAGTQLAAPQVVRADSTSVSGGKIYFDKYFIHNNQWGGSGGSGWQSVWNWTSGSAWGWGTNFSWSGNTAIKAYPSCVLGWHWGTWSNNSGLPVRIWDNKSVNTVWNFSVSGTNSLNVAYDMFFHPMSNPTWQNNPSDEIMVWNYRSGSIYPAGTYQNNVTLAGVEYELYKGTADTWNIYTFIRKSNTTSVTLNLREFTNYIVYTKNWMDNSKFLTSVQSGTEVISSNGEGRMETSSYYCNIE